MARFRPFEPFGLGRGVKHMLLLEPQVDGKLETSDDRLFGKLASESWTIFSYHRNITLSHFGNHKSPNDHFASASDDTRFQARGVQRT